LKGRNLSELILGRGRAVNIPESGKTETSATIGKGEIGVSGGGGQAKSNLRQRGRYAGKGELGRTTQYLSDRGGVSRIGRRNLKAQLAGGGPNRREKAEHAEISPPLKWGKKASSLKLGYSG